MLEHYCSFVVSMLSDLIDLGSMDRDAVIRIPN